MGGGIKGEREEGIKGEGEREKEKEILTKKSERINKHKDNY